MGSRLPSWILLLYLAIDLVNPFVPGAFHFTPERGAVWVEAASHFRDGVDADAVRGEGADPASPPSHRAAGDAFRSSGPLRAWHRTAWLAGVRSGDPPARDFPPADSDDH